MTEYPLSPNESLGIIIKVVNIGLPYMKTKSIRLSFFVKWAMAASKSLSFDLSFKRSPFSMYISAKAPRRSCPVLFLAYVLMRFRAEKERSTEEVDTGMVSTRQVR